MTSIQLPSGKLKMLTKNLRLINFPRKQNVSTLFLQLKHLSDAYDFEFQRKLIASVENSKNEEQ